LPVPRNRKELLLFACELDRRELAVLARPPRAALGAATSVARVLRMEWLLPVFRPLLPRKLRWLALAAETAMRVMR
jgi:hypothetical protein